MRALWISIFGLGLIALGVVCSYQKLESFCAVSLTQDKVEQYEKWRDAENNAKRGVPAAHFHEQVKTESHATTGSNNPEEWKKEFFCDFKGSGFAIGWGTFLLVLVTGGLIWTAFRQEESARRIERAYVFVEIELLEWRDDPTSTTVLIATRVKFWNYGKTPAVIKVIRGSLISRPISEPSPQELGPMTGLPLPPSIGIAPNTFYELLGGVRQGFPRADTRDINNTMQTLYCIGTIQYDDILGKPHETSYCWDFVTIGGGNQWVPTRGSALNKRT